MSPTRPPTRSVLVVPRHFQHVHVIECCPHGTRHRKVAMYEYNSDIFFRVTMGHFGFDIALL